MKVIYIAGAYRDERGEWFVRQNIRTAEAAAQFVWQHGAAALCPHKNTSGLGGLPGCPDQVWLEGDKELLRRCDAVWAIKGWRKSKGASGEVELARSSGMRVLFCEQEVLDFIKQRCFRGMVIVEGEYQHGQLAITSASKSGIELRVINLADE
jgi:hypothetical protein